MFACKCLVADDGSIIYISSVKPPEVDTEKHLEKLLETKTESDPNKSTIEAKKTEPGQPS